MKKLNLPPIIIGFILILVGIFMIYRSVVSKYDFPDNYEIKSATVTDYNEYEYKTSKKESTGMMESTRHMFAKQYSYTYDNLDYAVESPVRTYSKGISKNIHIIVNTDDPKDSVPIIDLVSNCMLYGIFILLGLFAGPIYLIAQIVKYHQTR